MAQKWPVLKCIRKEELRCTLSEQTLTIPDTERALGIEAALGNAGSARDRSFRVPSILGEEE